MAMKKLIGWACAVLAFGASLGATPNGRPSRAALQVASHWTVAKLGVEARSNLWGWNATAGTVELLSPRGAVLGQAAVRGASALDASEEWGIVGLFEVERTLRWLSWDGEEKARLPLAGPAMDVCWVGPGLVAVTPELAPHRVEIWSLQDKRLVRTMGQEARLVPGPGATRLRGVELRYDFARRLLHTLETFTGDLQVFRDDGGLAGSARIENPEAARVEEWLRGVDRRAKAENDMQTPVLRWLTLAVDPAGDDWVGQKVEGTPGPGGSATWVRVRRGRETPVTLRSNDCLALKLAFWGDSILQYRSPDSAWKPCLTVRSR
jgi:hypothetical protein